MIEKQIADNYRRAFYDLIDATVASKEPDYCWIVNLYKEIRYRLIRYVKKDSNTYKQIDEEFDVELFDQMIRNDVFDATSMINLINNTFKWIKKLQAPSRDEYTESAKMRVLQSSFDKIVSEFIKEVNTCIDFIDEDMKNFFLTEQVELSNC